MIPVFCSILNYIPVQDLAQESYIVISIGIPICAREFLSLSAALSATSGVWVLVFASRIEVNNMAICLHNVVESTAQKRHPGIKPRSTGMHAGLLEW